VKKKAAQELAAVAKLLATYGRTSTDKQDTGLEAQQRTLREWCKANGHENYLEFADAGVSGMKSSRPEFDKMMAKVRAGEIGTVLVYSFSRFARSTKHLIDSLEEFNRLGVSFISKTEQIDTSTPIGKAMFTIISAIAQLERDLTAERVRNGLRNARAKGKVLGRPKAREDAPILELHRAGLKVAEIASRLKITRQSVYRALKAA
jgi:DNA invertase Pin-like site-specific DNA recombinase